VFGVIEKKKRHEKCIKFRRLVTLEIHFIRQNKSLKFVILVLIIWGLNMLYFKNLKQEKTILVAEKLNTYKEISEIESSLNALVSIEAIKSIIKQYNRKMPDEEAEFISNHIFHQSNKNGFDPLFVASIIITESMFQPDVVSHKGAVGLMQIKPSTARYIADLMNYDFAGSGLNLNDSQINIHLGLNYLKHLVNKFDGDLNQGLVAYNIGEYNLYKILKNGNQYPTSYINRIQKHYTKVKKDYNFILNQLSNG